jgi:RNA polymerase sigma-70 factor (ECF subfamily)
LDRRDGRVEKIAPRLRRLAHALVCEPAKADELAQAAINKVTSEAAQLGQDIGSDTDVIRVLRNLWMSHREEWQPALPLEPSTDLERVTQAMAALPSAQREAVALVVIDELQYRDAADIARISVATLAERLVAGRATLTTLLREKTA